MSNHTTATQSIPDPLVAPPEGAHAEAIEAIRTIRRATLTNPTIEHGPSSRQHLLEIIAAEIANAATPAVLLADALEEVVEEDDPRGSIRVRSDLGSSRAVRISAIEDLRKSGERLRAIAAELRGYHLEPRRRRPLDEHDVAKGLEDARDERLAALRGDP